MKRKIFDTHVHCFPDKLEGKVLALPKREDIDSQIAEHMIVELYSK